MSCKLPEGIYVVSADFREQEGMVSFDFRGTAYEAEIGVNAFGRLDDMSKAADKVPAEPFCGRTFDVPVAVLPAGVYPFKMTRADLCVFLDRAIAIVGEQMGVSPNAADDVSAPNPARTGPESIMEGSFYYGAVALDSDQPGVLCVDGVTIKSVRIQDRRTSGKDIGLDVRNCIIEGSHHNNIVAGYALKNESDSRTITVADCRVDGFDSRDGQGCFIHACATELTVERVYYAHTKEFFGLTNYSRSDKNTIANVPASITLRGCVLEECQCVHGLSVALSEEAKHVSVTVEDCIFRDFAVAKDPALYVQLPDASCSLTVKNTAFSTTRGNKAAIMVDGTQDAPVTVDSVTADGFGEVMSYKPPRRTEAPEYVGEVVWADELLDDPHAACEEAEEDQRQLTALYSGRKALHGDMHTHSNSGGTSDGKTPLAKFIKQIKELGLDFAACVDHKQMRHAFLPEWDEDVLIFGTEPAVVIQEEGRPRRSAVLHYCMLFQHPADLYRVMEAFPEYEYTGGPDGHYKYASFTPERFAQLGRFIHSLGGLMVHAHPKQMLSSDDPMDYYFGEVVPLETILGDADAYDTWQNRDLWESLLKLGKRIHTHGDSDTHGAAKNRAITTVYARERKGAAILREVREGDCAAGAIGIKMAISGARMGSSLPYREGLVLAIQLDDYYKPTMLDDTVYCLKVYTDRGLAYASEFDGKQPQSLSIPVKERKYYRVEVTNESDGSIVSVSNPIWLD